MLDEAMRRRLATVAGASAADDLDGEARERIVQAVVASGPRMIQRARATRFVTRAAFAMLACAAGVVLALRFTADDHTVVVEIGGLELIGTLLLIRGDALGTDNDPSTMVAIKTVVSPTGKLLPEA